MINVVDHRSNPEENVVNAAKFIGTSWWKREVFREIYRGKGKAKTADHIADRMGVKVKRVLETGVQLRKAGLVHQQSGRPVTYEKEDFLDQNKARILRLAANKEARGRVATKSNPKPGLLTVVRLKVWGSPFKVEEVTVDDIESFKKVRRIKKVPSNPMRIPEKTFKEGVKKVIGEKGRFVDWPGEKNDLLTTRVMFRGKRTATAFAFKGPGKKGILQPAMMGRNGNQIQKLFESDADLFILQYWAQIGEPTRDMVTAFARLRSGYLGKRVHYCLLDGDDSKRLILAYPMEFDWESED